MQTFMDEAEGRIDNSPGNTLNTSTSTVVSSAAGSKKTPNAKKNRRSSVSDGAESLSRSASDSSVSVKNGQQGEAANHG